MSELNFKPTDTLNSEILIDRVERYFESKKYFLSVKNTLKDSKYLSSMLYSVEMLNFETQPEIDLDKFYSKQTEPYYYITNIKFLYIGSYTYLRYDTTKTSTDGTATLMDITE